MPSKKKVLTKQIDSIGTFTRREGFEFFVKETVKIFVSLICKRRERQVSYLPVEVIRYQKEDARYPTWRREGTGEDVCGSRGRGSSS